MVLLLVLLLPDFLLSAKKQFGDLIIGIIALPLIILCEAIILGTTGTTFGKWLLNIKIVSKTDNQNISFFDALKRTVLLWVKGLGFGLPIINFIPMVLAARRIKKNGTASWDDSISAVVKCSPLNALDVVIAVLAVLVLLFVNGIVSEVAGVK